MAFAAPADITARTGGAHPGCGSQNQTPMCCTAPLSCISILGGSCNGNNVCCIFANPGSPTVLELLQCVIVQL
ncbi:hypothetical protein B0H67DRAFT_649292 [Lasiosphaeris hirsuta]|uniref:Hydrophobin n=1 Tax=Lasiosphaeris hirsuta TaxID=260670 RepID=A0AA39ZWL0_9PEZI|nr:hypothetical protein B0H67DRAFT_649292 [Lasiosphaeris hirsuta]